ncbi:MAG: DNA-3-methyladenine glycosylase [Patescibacteria group bacterium]|nr:DNA-3-methyladenine glycosylase [Patescibacteria group bacterium]
MIERKLFERVLSTYVGEPLNREKSSWVDMRQKVALREKLPTDFFMQEPTDVAKGLLGMNLVRVLPSRREIRGRIQEVAAYKGEADSVSDVAYYGPGIIGVSTKYGKHLIDIATESEGVPSCVTLIGAFFQWGKERQLVHGPGNLSRALKIDGSDDGVPIVCNDLWIDPSVESVGEIYTRNLSNIPENCLGYFYIRE